MYPCLAHLDLAALTGALKDVVESIAIIIAGIWTYRKFIRFREDQSKIDATADLTIIGEHEGTRLAVVTAEVTNSGKVRHNITRMHFDLRVIRQGQPLQVAENRMNHVDFPEKLYSAQPLFPSEWKWSFIEPGATNHYRYSVILPLNVKFALVNVKVVLPGDDQFFSSWRIFNVAGSGGEPFL